MAEGTTAFPKILTLRRVQGEATASLILLHGPEPPE